MRVAIGAIARTLGGPATYAIELIRALAARRDAAFEYVVLTDGPEAFDGLDVEIARLPLPSPYAQVWWDHVEVPRALRRLGADLYHGTKQTLPVWLPCPAVLSIHDLSVYAHPESFAAVQRWHQRLHTPLGVRAAAVVLTGSEHAAADVRRHFPAGAAKVRAIPYAVPDRFHPLDDEGRARAAFRARHGLGSGPLVGYLGTLQPRKNVELLAAAFGRIAGRFPAAELVLAGRIRPGYRPALPRERVRLIGPLEGAAVPDFYRTVDVLVSPSLYEGFGFTLLEAMACGCPVIGLRRSSVPEVVGDAGILLDAPTEEGLAEALARVLGDPALAADLRARGIARAGTFSWARTAAATAAVYAELGSVR